MLTPHFASMQSPLGFQANSFIKRMTVLIEQQMAKTEGLVNIYAKFWIILPYENNEVIYNLKCMNFSQTRPSGPDRS